MNRIRDVYIKLNIYGFDSYNLALLKEKYAIDDKQKKKLLKKLDKKYARHRIIKKYTHLGIIK